MPFDVTAKKSKSGGNQKAFSHFEIMGDVTYLSRKMHISPDDVWNLPHSHYLSHMKWNVTFDLQQTEEGQEILDKFERYMNPRTEADLSTIRRRLTGGYKTVKEGGE